MTITVDLPPEIQEWLTRKLESGKFASPADFIRSRLRQDWLEEKIEEALQEPAVPMTPDDWGEARRRVEGAISENQ